MRRSRRGGRVGVWNVERLAKDQPRVRAGDLRNRHIYKGDLRGLELTIGASQKSWCWLFAQLLLLKFG
jgi:hypothetical protein